LEVNSSHWLSLSVSGVDELFWGLQENLLPIQRKGEDALQNLLLLGIRPPVRRLASAAMIKFIELGDSISIYSRASSLQGWLSDKADVRKSEPAACIGMPTITRVLACI
jgi:hypothetical protein